MNSAGCVFKNLSPAEALAKAGTTNTSAGYIIDRLLNLKGFSIGAAQISPLHANFIVNTGNCAAKDYLSLIRYVQQQAKTKLNLSLELEIKLLGQF
jgi:UDP-N-acetylmuramate dehydrogenase